MPPKRKSEGDVPAPRRSSRTISSAKPAEEKKDNKIQAVKREVPQKPEAEADAGKQTAEPTSEAKDVKLASKIAIGDRIPATVLLDDSSKKVNLRDISDESGFVLFSYPAASTPGCTSQACSYRDNFAEITKKGFKVFGISTDTVNAQSNFKTKKGFQYPLLSDPKKELLIALGGGTTSKKTALRCHWVVKKGGILESAEINVKPKDCVAKALKTIESIEVT